ncbi:PelD GGDEF domain-containing protein [Marinobacter bohaiensis]|uniref:PelD GGDEF domain-containing protein n=1 Tax=Marinobacter bohaiensis TaxID=2201898 RepID=UPI000DAEB744|nr:PelD GGDEF domain-containing protein [Marinobacter bohaiensis]
MVDTSLQSALRPQEASDLLKWLETLLITLACFALGAWSRPDDPFFLTGNFPWPVIGPLLVALRYGFFMALAASLLLIGGLGMYLRYLTDVPQPYPFTWAAGVLAVVLLAGEFRDYWERRRSELAAANDYRDGRLEEFTRSYYLLKVSHDRLEQRLAGSSRSLREALRRVYSELAADSHAGLTRDRAQATLALFGHYGQIQTAGVFPVRQGRLTAQALASIGEFKPLSGSDPLIEHALRERKLVSIQTEYHRRQAELDSRFLAVIPLLTSDGEILGVVAVEAMPFFSFEPQTLRFLAILAGHLADQLQEQDLTPAGETEERRHFRRQLARVGRDAERFDLPACLLCFRADTTLTSRQIVDHIKSVRRGLDVLYEASDNHGLRLAILMPLTDELGQSGYLQRLEDGVRETLGVHLADWLGAPASHQVSDRATAESWLEAHLAHGQ